MPTSWLYLEFVANCPAGSGANNHAVWGWISVSSVMLRNVIYSGVRAWSQGRNGIGCRGEEEINQGTSAAMLSSRGRFLQWPGYECSNAVEQRMIPAMNRVRVQWRCRAEDDSCNDQGTSAATLLSRGWFPEAATMRGWPMPIVQAQTHSYLHRLASCRRCSCTRIMVNLWVQQHSWAERDFWRQQRWEADQRRHATVTYAKYSITLFPACIHVCPSNLLLS